MNAARVAVLAACLLGFAHGAGASSASTLAGLIDVRQAGVEAVLPANAATGAKRSAFVSSVSCPSEGSCSAVGSYQDSSGDQEGLLLTETAGVWRAGVEAVLPANAVTGGKQSVSLSSVSCPSSGHCSAVGTYSDSWGNVWGLLVDETAGSWAAGVESVLPANATVDGSQSVSLSSVSCPSPGNCAAVGTYVLSTASKFLASAGLLLTETGGDWASGAQAGLPRNASTGSNQYASLDAVSCPSPGNCSAVGNYSDNTGNGDGLLLSETAGQWGTGVEARLPANAAHSNQSASFNSVSCAAPGSCGAVGTYLDRSAADQGLLLSEEAGSWGAGIEASLPADAATTFQVVVPGAISCPSAGNCSAVGDYFDRSDNIQGLLLDQRANRWGTGTEVALPANAATAQQWVLLNSVSCLSAENCTAVGKYIDRSGRGQGLLVTAAGGSWPRAVEAAHPSNAYLASVSCPPGQRRSCTGVGSYRSSSGSPQGLLVGIPAGPTPEPCVVPQLKGKTLTAAENSINFHHCTLGRIKHAASPTIPRGRVISQQPRAGMRAQHQAKVDLVVSKGP